MLGVVCGALFAVSATRAAPPVGWWLLLPLCTWTVYSVDHLLDSRQLAGAGTRNPRHRFFVRHFRALGLVTASLLFLLPALAAVTLARPALLTGALLAALSGGYLLGARRAGALVLPKELAAAALYTVGIWFVPLMAAGGGGADAWLLLLMGLHLAAATANLAVFSLFEAPIDARDGQPSIVGSWGPGRTRRLVLALTGLAVVASWVAVVLAPPHLRAHFAVAGLVAAVPALLDLWRPVFAGGGYRTVGDLAFLLLALPALFR